MGRRRWQNAYVRRVVVSDAGAAALAAAVGYLLASSSGSATTLLGRLGMALALPIAWLLAMVIARSYEKRFLWDGPDEFRRVLGAAVTVQALLGYVSWAADLRAARGIVVVAVPLAALSTLAERYAWRLWLRREHRAGRCVQRILLVGNGAGVAALHDQIQRYGGSGHLIVGCCLPAEGRAWASGLDDPPVLGDLDDVVDVVRRHDVDTAAVVPSAGWEGPALRRLGWELEKTGAELLLAPTVIETTGPRVRLHPQCGLPMVHIARPELRGVRRLTKGLLDRGGAALGVLVLAPVLLGIALAVKVTSRGPVFFRQERVGRDGVAFSMLKFRTMVDGADQMLEFLTAANDGNGVLFKRKDDPRVTGVGRVLRRLSLDELPQLFNVVRGEMSLVGPRPSLPSEVARYGFDMHRRFLVKPGLTGLWQVSGRSDLSWDDSVRIDVQYVENWSLALDLLILGRTLGAVIRGSGAY